MLKGLAYVIGYVFLVVGGLWALFWSVYWLIIGISHIPLFNLKVLKILNLGRQAYLEEKRKTKPLK